MQKKTKNNILLHKDEVGKPRPPTSKLPSQSYAYGQTNLKPEAGMRELIHDWTY